MPYNYHVRGVLCDTIVAVLNYQLILTAHKFFNKWLSKTFQELRCNSDLRLHNTNGHTDNAEQEPVNNVAGRVGVRIFIYENFVQKTCVKTVTTEVCCWIVQNVTETRPNV